MIPWYFGTAIGAIALCFVNFWCKSHDMSIRSQAIILIPLIVCNLGFWYGLINTENFLKTYYTGSALSLLAGFGLSLFVFDKFISGWSIVGCLLYTSPSPRDRQRSRMPSSA